MKNDSQRRPVSVGFFNGIKARPSNDPNQVEIQIRVITDDSGKRTYKVVPKTRNKSNIE
jgi:hypothetical protein